MGVSPEEIPRGMPHLTLGQIFGALTYYSDHQEEINHYIEKIVFLMSCLIHWLKSCEKFIYLLIPG